MNELSLFSGAGGGLLATKHLLGWNCIGYVENNEYCQKVLLQRIKDGFLDAAPIFGDIREFISEGYAESYQGMVDLVTAGFPCQSWSAAGCQKGENDHRNLWPETIKCIRLVRPRYVFLENVPRLLTKSYWGTILGQLAESGYSGRYATLPAYIAGAPQVGQRIWLLVSTHSEGLERIHKKSGGINMQSIKIDIPTKFWEATPRVYSPSNGIPNRVERTQALGNAQVPTVAALAWKVLTE